MQIIDVMKATFVVTSNAKCLLSSLMSANKKIVNSVPLLTCAKEGQQHSAHLFEILGCVRLGNLDLDLKIWIFGFPIEHKI